MMNPKQQLKQIRAQIGELQTKKKPIHEAIVRVQQPNPDAAAAVAEVSQKLSLLAQIRAKFARGEVEKVEVDQAAKLLTEARAKAVELGTGDDGIAEAVALLQRDAADVDAQILELQAEIPEIERQILRERALSAIESYDKAARTLCKVFDEMHAALAAYHPRALPGQHLWPSIRSKQIELPHIAVDDVKFDGVDFHGIFKHVPNQSAIQRRAAAIEAEELE